MDEESADIVFEVGSESGRNTRKKAKTTTTLYGHQFIINCCESSVLGELCTSGEDVVSIPSRWYILILFRFVHVQNFCSGGLN